MLRVWRYRMSVGLSAGLVAVSSLTLYAFAVWFGNLNQDEGWYLYAATRVAEGAVPYRDFFFTQGPMMPYVYGLFIKLWHPYGVLGGRVFTVGLGLLGCVLAAGLARRAVPHSRAMEAGVLAFALTGCNLYHVYFTTIPKTYALASCLLLAGYLVLSLCISRRRKMRSMLSCMWALPAGLLIAFAAGTRLSLGALLPVTTLGLLLMVRRTGSAFFWFALGGGLGLVLVYGPAWLMAPDQFVFGQTYHVARGGRDWMYLLGSFARSVRAYLPLFLLAAARVIFYLFRGRTRVSQKRTEDPSGVTYRGELWPWLWAAGFVAVFSVQLASPFPYDDYQVPVMGLFAAAIAGWVVNAIPVATVRGCVCLVWVSASLLTSFGLPLIQEWMVHGQDRFWVRRKACSDLDLLRRTARDIQALSENDPVLLTQDTYLAVEAGLRVPAGLEMGPFSYFPDLSDDDAERFHVMNATRLTALLDAAPCRVAAISGYGYAVRAPVMDQVPDKDRQRYFSLLGQHYDRVQEVSDFGQNGTTLYILKRRTAVTEKPAG